MTNTETTEASSTNKVLLFGLIAGVVYLGTRDWSGDDDVLIQGAMVCQRPEDRIHRNYRRN